MRDDLLLNAAQIAIQYRQTVDEIPVVSTATRAELAAQLDQHLPETGEPPEAALRALVTGVERGLVNSANPRYFGFVMGGSTPVSIAADWLTSAWNQNAQVYLTSPAAALVEEVVAGWLLDLLGLPGDAGVGFVTGTQMAHFTALSVARNAVLARHGWDIDAEGLQGAPHINVVCGECCHATLHSAIRMMGLGTRNIRTVTADDEGRMRTDAFRQALAECSGPTIVCLQAGNVNTGSFDPFAELIPIAREKGAWAHVDGAFGLWAAASPRDRWLTAGVESADSWSTDAHKWLNVPYDSGMVIIRDANAHRALKTARCAYAGTESAVDRDGSQWVPENSRRARAFVLYAALRAFGRQGVAEIVEHCCDMARAFADRLASLPGAQVLNQVALNQVLCRFDPPVNADPSIFHTSVARRLQREGACWIGATQWRGQTALRISVSNGATSLADVETAVGCVERAVALERRAIGD
ncbi:MAG TPA: aminotransferase class V-fold PLP-dependent enzyme [Armatimonadota bacterium]|jgi:glutamate/tyrosine decarboxylase-like PLP-dependent enzyme